MNTEKQNNSSNENLPTIEDIISLIEAKSAGGGYIYRGERKCYPKVSSGLYRELSLEAERFNIEVVHTHSDGQKCYSKVSSSLYRELSLETEYFFDIEVVQKEMLTAAKKHTGHRPQDFPIDFTEFLNVDEKDTEEVIDFEILTELQHYGGNTNLIDFTTDYCIALFFACDGAPGEDGRFILQKIEAIRDWIHHPRNPRHRVVAQKSVFVRPPKGFIEPAEDDIVIIPAALKKRMLEYLRNYHGISTETIYNDLHGFIINQGIHRSAYTEFYRGLVRQDRAAKATTDEEKQQEYARAIAHYTKVTELKPDFPEIYNIRGLAYQSKGEIDRAIRDYTKTIQLDPNNASAYCDLGNVYMGENDCSNAISSYTKAIELQPDFAKAHSNRGNAYKEKGDFDSAINDYTTAIKLQPDDTAAYNNRGVAYKEKGDIDSAINDYTTTIKLQPNNATAYSNRGNAYIHKGDIDSAINDYTEAIELEPDLAQAYYNRGYAYTGKGDFDGAINDYTTAIQLQSDYAEAYYNRGVVQFFLQSWENARADLITAKNLGVDIASVENFELILGIQLLEDIAALLTPPQA